jgi:hypothetical protein
MLKDDREGGPVPGVAGATGEELQGFFHDLPHGLADAAQPGAVLFSRGDAVEAQDGNIPRHLEAPVFEGGQGSQGADIAVGEEGAQGGFLLQKFSGPPVA